MPLTGLEIYKMLPQTNCKDCGFPTCLAFAMKLAAKQAELKDCPHVSEEAASKLAAAAAPPIRLVAFDGGDGRVEIGNETVLFRHEKTFYHKPGIFLRLRASDETSAVLAAVEQAAAFQADYVGIELPVDGFAIDADGADAGSMAETVEAVRGATKKPLVLMTPDPEAAKAAVAAADGTRPLLYAASADNWQPMADLAKEAGIPLVASAPDLDALADLSGSLLDAGLEDLILDPQVHGYAERLETLTAIRRLALKDNFKPLGFPVITFPGTDPKVDATMAAAQDIAKYAGIVVLDEFDPASLYALLVLRENIYTDPQKPIQVQPGLYEINTPQADSPLLVTTNFSITYFSVANEVEGSGWPAWLLVADADGQSVLTAWAAGKFDAETIAKSVKSFDVEAKVDHKRIILPGHVAVLSGELEEELPGWEIMVGPREAVDIASYLKTMWAEG
jgi:acetyl-CoA decarbonylase/synthase complex subunit gamma